MNTRECIISSSSTVSDIQAALAAGAALSAPFESYAGTAVIVPEGYELKSGESFQQHPNRAKGKYTFNDAASFCRYYEKHKNNSEIYGRINPPRFIAVLDDHQSAGEPGWRDHTAVYACPLSTEWSTWTSNNKKPFKQSAFAQFIEDNLPDIAEPSGADMLEISRSLEAKKKVNFVSAVRLSNGQQEFTYAEEVQGTASKGKLQIPETFVLGIPVLEGGESYRVEARFRYRIDSGELTMWFDLLRPHKILEDAVLQVWKAIEKDLNQVILNGEPDTITR